MLVPNSEEICVNINECLGNPCVNGECIDRDRGFECHCFTGYSGTYCTAKEEAYTAYVSHGFIIAIVICVLVVLCKYLDQFIFIKRIFLLKKTGLHKSKLFDPKKLSHAKNCGTVGPVLKGH